MKQAFKHPLMVALIILALTFSALGVSPALAAGPGTDWPYQLVIPLNGPTPASDFQVQVKLLDLTHMAPNGDDLRFYDASDAAASYWVETWDGAAEYAIVWVKVPSEGTTSLTMYYGNPGAAPVSSGSDTFIAFDDFSGSAVDASKWDVTDANASITVSGGSVTLTSGPAGAGDQLISKIPFTVSDGVIVESVLSSDVTIRSGARSSLSGASTLSGSGTYFTADYLTNSSYAVWSAGRNDVFGYASIHDGDGAGAAAPIYAVNVVAYNGYIWPVNGSVFGTAFEDGRLEYFLNFNSQGMSTTNALSGSTTLYPLLTNYWDGSGDGQVGSFSVSAFRVRKFVSSYNALVSPQCSNPSTVTNNADSGTGSLRRALTQVCRGGTINFDASLSGATITLASTLTIGQELTLDGSTLTTPITMDGNNAVNVFTIQSGVNAALKGLVVAHGRSTTVYGGGIRNYGTLTVTDSAISGNRASSGGGLYNNFGAAATVTNSTFSDNSTTSYGGGIRNYGTLTVTGSTFSNNSASASGGGIFNENQVTITDSIFSGNSASSGGGIRSTNLTSTLKLTVTNSSFSDNTALGEGGGINNYGLFTVTGSAFSDNSAASGGGIYNYSSASSLAGTVANSTFSDNSSTNAGGGIDNSGNLIVIDSTLTGNSSTSGGGISSYNRTLTVIGSTLSGNSATNGGGIYNRTGTIALTASTLSDNSATNSGGGIYNNAALTAANSTLGGNSAANGGGIYNNTGTIALTASTLSGNSATNSGGGIYNNATLTAANSTLSGNSATGSGGGAIANANGTFAMLNSTITNNTAADPARSGIYLTNGALNLSNSILANNNGGNNFAVSGGILTSQGYNLADNWNGVTTATGDLTADPKFGALGDYGGPTQTMPILIGSPAIDAGNDTVCADPLTVNNLDQRGVVRPVNVTGAAAAHCDIGAYEANPTQTGPVYIVNSNADTNDDSCDLAGSGSANKDCTLREALTAANARISADGIITFDNDYLITLTSGQLTVNRNMTIDGSGHKVVVSGGGVTRVFSVNSGVTAIFNALTIANGYHDNQGGGVYNAGTLSLTNSTLLTNTADYGGGLYNAAGATVTAVNNTFSGNSAITGGGFYNESTAVLKVINNTLSGNVAGLGSDIRNYGILQLMNSILANSAGGANCASAALAVNLNNLIEDGTCGTGAVNLLTIDPKLGALADNGGSTPTFKLLTDSPAIDAGDDVVCADPLTVDNLDQRGVTRPQGAHCDIGSYERLASVYLPLILR